MDEFALAFNNADVLYVLDIYAASETPIEGITAEVLTENIRNYGSQKRDLHRQYRYCCIEVVSSDVKRAIW